MAGPETVYAIHNFVAENQDEIAFSIGEPIIVLEKDEGYNDGWWKGRNKRGEIGLFPANYTSPEPPVTPKPSPPTTTTTLSNNVEYLPSPQLPTPSTSTSTKKSREALPRSNSISSLNSAQSRSAPATRPLGVSGGGAKQTQKLLEAALRHPQLSGTAPEDWDVDQVATWLQAMGFESVADNFKAQEITGDILLELNLEALKELDVNTFGKRFKIQSAINALREETNVGPIEQESNQTNVDGAKSRTQLKADHDSISTFNSPQPAITNYGSISSMSSSFSQDTRFQSVDSTMSATRPRATFDSGVDRQMSISRKDLPRSASTLIKNQYTNNTFVDNSANKRNTYNVQPTTTSVQSSVIQQSSAHKSRHDLVRNSFSPTSKMQTVIPAPTRASVDSLAQRSAMPDVMPDMEGWLHKQGDKYKTWNRRWFVLKGPNLFYFKSPKDVRMKGIINLRGYRIICDETIYAGKYCFKAQHERERTFYFYTETEDSLRGWTKALMKATIARDFAAPVLSSSTIPTVSLDIARRMKPRPPSMILYKRETRPQSPSLESVDMRPFSRQDRHQPITTHVSLEAERRPMSPTRAPSDAQQTRESGVTVYEDDHLPRATSITGSSSMAESKHHDLQDSGFDSAPINTGPSSSIYVTPSSPNANEFYDLEEEDEDLIDPQHGDVLASNRPGGLKRLTEESRLSSEPEHLWRTSDYIDWINRSVDHKISDLSDLRSGEVLLQLLETISGKEIRRPLGSGNSSSGMRMFDNIAAAFKFMGREGVEVDGRYTIKDVFNGNEDKIKEMLDAIRSWSNTLHDEKKASGGTFGEQEQEKLKSLDISNSSNRILYDDNFLH